MTSAEYTPLVDSSIDIRKAYNALSPSERTSLESSLKRRLDRRLFPCLVTFYLLNYIDRNALPAARLLGVESDLNLNPREYAACLGVLYVGYLLMQIPSNLLMTRFRPSKYLSGWMIVWGLVSMGTAMVQGFKGLFFVRFALGFCEAPFFPGAIFLLSSWYKPTELALRVALLFGGSLLSGSFGALIALGITNVVGDAGGWNAWRWLFITEGSATVLFAIVALFILPDYPHNTSWLTPGESLVAQGRLLKPRESRVSQGRLVQPEDEPEDTTSMVEGFTSMLSDSKVYLLALNHFIIVLCASFTNFFPTILQNLFTSTASNTYLLLTPPYLIAFVVTSLLCHHADITKSRTKHIIPSYLLTILCALSLAHTPNYFSLIVISSAIYTAMDVNLAWVSNTIPAPHAKRAASIAMVNMCANVANIVGAWVWVGDGKDGFPWAWVVVAGSAAAGVLVTGGLGAWLRRENLRGATYVV